MAIWEYLNKTTPASPDETIAPSLPEDILSQQYARRQHKKNLLKLTMRMPSGRKGITASLKICIKSLILKRRKRQPGVSVL